MKHEGLYPALRSEGARGALQVGRGVGRMWMNWKKKKKKAVQGRNRLILRLGGV